MKLDQDLYVYEWTDFLENNCNSYFIGGSLGILIDPGLKKFFPDLLDRLGEDGVREEHIRYVLNTHSHPDHFEGAVLFNGNSNVKIGLNREEQNFHEKSGKLLYSWFGLDIPEVEIDLDLPEGPLVVDNEPFEILLTPGHSPGSVCLYWPLRKALFCGDVIFNQNVGRTDFPGGSGELLKRSILSLSKLDVEHLLPGHMDVITGAERVRRNFAQVIEFVFPCI